MSVYLRQYGAAATIRFTLRQADSNAFATNSHWTPAAGDVKLSAGGGALADVTNLPTYANGQWSLSLTAGELAANPLAVLIDDAAIIPESFIVETFGHASATYPTSYGDQWLGIAAKITADHGAGSYVDTGPGLDAAGVRSAVGLAAANLDTQLGAIPTVAPLDATATEAAAAAALVAYDAASASDLSGLLTQSQFNAALPANFGTLSINASGEVIASNMVSPAPDSTAIQSAANAALVAYQTAKTTDLAGLLTQTHFDSALPANFGVLSIDTSGNVSTTGGGSGGATAQEVWEYGTRTLTESGALTTEQATQLEETHAKAMLIGDYPQILVDRDPAIGERFSLHKGADYKDSLSNALRIVDVGGSVLPAATTQVKIEIGHRVHHDQFATIDGAVEADGSDLVAVFDVLATDTAGLSPGPCDYSIYEFVDSQWRRLDIAGQCQIERGIRGV